MHVGRTVAVLLICLLLTLSVPVTGTAAASGQQPTDTDGSRTSVIVVFQNETVINSSLITANGGTITGGQTIDTLPVLFAELNDKAIAILENRTDVRTVTPDHTVTTTAPQTTDHNQTLPWGVDRINASAPATELSAHQKTNISVAVVDTGVDYRHEDLNESVIWGVSTVGNGSIEYGRAAADDIDGHGTHVAGTIAAEQNDYGVVGVSPGVDLYAIQVLNETGGGTLSDLIEGIDEAVKGPDNTINTSDDADIISLSLGSETDNQALAATIENASDHAVIVAAAGNSGDDNESTDNVVYPARYEAVIAVGATDTSDSVPNWSSDGPPVEIAAPGNDILSTTPDDTYSYSSGTSMATPHVSGTIALMLANAQRQNGSSLSTEQIRDRLYNTSIDIGPTGPDRYAGHGLIQADRAVRNDIQLALSANTTRIMVNETVRFTLTRANASSQRVNGTLHINNATISTDTDGTATYRFTQNGTYPVTATKSPTTLETYQSTTLSVTVTNESLASRYDENENHRLDLREIQTAIREWAQGKLTLTEIQLLIQQWASAATV